MIHHAFSALGAALLLAGPFSVSAQTASGNERGDPEVVRLTMRGVKAFTSSDIQQSISTEASHCRGLILTPFCWITKARAVYQRLYLNRTELARDVLRIRVFYWKRGFRETEVDTVVTPQAGGVAVTFRVKEGAPTLVRKIAVGPAGRGCIDLAKTATENLAALAEAKRCRIEDLTAIILERPRHQELIAEVRKTGARIRLIGDGDVSGAISTCKSETGIDILFGTGGAPEGVLAAAALRCLGGEIQGRLRYRSDDEKRRAEKMGVKDHDRIYKTEDLAQGHVMFAATGVTHGSFLGGVRFHGGGAASTHSVVMRSKSGTVRFIEAQHHLDQKPNYEWLSL